MDFVFMSKNISGNVDVNCIFYFSDKNCDEVNDV